MKINKWTQVLLGVGLISVPAITHAEEKQNFVQTALSSTTLSGYVDTSAILNMGSGSYYNLPGHTYDTAEMQNGFNLDVVSLTLAKPLDESEWAAGYNVQMLFGPGATKRGTGSFIPGTVNNNDPATQNTLSGGDFAFNEAYVVVRVPVGNGLDFKIGQFGTYNGYEAYDTYKDPTWTRSYGFYIESSAHTGISASYMVNEVLSITAGIANMAGFNNQVNAKYNGSAAKEAYMAIMTLTAPESFGAMKGATLSAGYTGGVNGGGAGSQNSNGWMQGNYYVGASIPTPLKNLSAGLAWDYTTGMIDEGSYAQAFATYLSLQATEKLKLNARADFGWGSQGVFGYTAAGGNDQLFSLTLTADYSLWANVVSRLEFRWDECMTNDKPFGGTFQNQTPDSKEDFALILNIIYMF
jgi:Putative beta-barrel porin-2, OmpL-like. bbp2